MTINRQSLHEILRIRALKQKLSISESSIYNKLNPKSKYFDKTFPRPIRLSPGCVGWVLAEVEEYIEARIAASRNDD